MFERNDLNAQKNRFKQKWIALFQAESAEMFVDNQCPILIGIMRRSTAESSWIFPSDYEFQVILKNDQITRTGECVTRATVLQELIDFKENYEKNEKDLVSIIETVFCCLNRMFPLDI